MQAGDVFKRRVSPLQTTVSCRLKNVQFYSSFRQWPVSISNSGPLCLRTIGAKDRVMIPYRVTCINFTQPRKEETGSGTRRRGRAATVVVSKALAIVPSGHTVSTSGKFLLHLVGPGAAAPAPPTGSNTSTPTGHYLLFRRWGAVSGGSGGYSGRQQQLHRQRQHHVGDQMYPSRHPPGRPCEESCCCTPGSDGQSAGAFSSVDLLMREYQDDKGRPRRPRCRAGCWRWRAITVRGRWAFDYGYDRLTLEVSVLGNRQSTKILKSDVPLRACSRQHQFCTPTAATRIEALADGFRWQDKRGEWKIL